MQEKRKMRGKKCYFSKIRVLLNFLLFPPLEASFQDKINFLRTIPLWSTGQDTCLPNGKAVVQILCSGNAFEPKDLNK